MTSTNNFDKSSTGVNIEFLGMMDTDRSQMDFRENIEIIQHDGYQTTSIGYYIDNGNVKGFDEIEFTVKGKTAVLRKYIIDNGRYYSLDEVKKMKKAELVELFMETLDRNRKELLIDFAMDKLENIDGLEVVPNKELNVITTRGYSQGDYAKVIYCPSDLKECWGNDPKKEDIQKMVDHYYWDAPVWARFTIDGKEYDYFDMPEYDEYEWEPDKFAAYVSKESGVPEDQLKPLLPKHLEY